jgi:hypothetical protein
MIGGDGSDAPPPGPDGPPVLGKALARHPNSKYNKGAESDSKEVMHHIRCRGEAPELRRAPPRSYRSCVVLRRVIRSISATERASGYGFVKDREQPGKQPPGGYCDLFMVFVLGVARECGNGLFSRARNRRSREQAGAGTGSPVLTPLLR